MKFKSLVLVGVFSFVSLSIPFSAVFASEKAIEPSPATKKQTEGKDSLKYRGFKVLGSQMHAFCEYQDKYGLKVLVPQRNFKNKCPKSIASDKVKN